jgi:peptidoglycan-associated lipoprotein
VAVKSYLLSLGIAADRIRTVSYGKEFPFDPGRSEEAFAKNRRGHFVITSK